MQNAPKIVVDRLKATLPAVNHPDADVLTAYAEKALPERERGGVIEHLARCADCREIAALALPPIESQVAIVAVRSTGWMTLPVLRWGVVAAGVVAIASFAAVQYHGRTQSVAVKTELRAEVPASVALNAAPATPASAESTGGLVANNPSALAGKEKDKDDKETGRGAASMKFVAPQLAVPRNEGKTDASDGMAAAGIGAGAPVVHRPQSRNSTFGQSIGGPAKNSMYFQQQNSNQINQAQVNPFAAGAAKQQPAATSAAPASATQTVELSSAAPQVEERVQGHDEVTARAKLDDDAGDRVGKAKDADTRAANAPAASGVSAKSLPFQSQPADLTKTYALVVPCFTVSSDGALQRSYDQGMTWQGVAVTLVPSTEAMNLRGSAAAAPRAAEITEDKKSLRRDAISPTFRAVATNGTDVWAGGSGGALYHSRDAGNHWTRVVPAASGATLTGDIVRLEFSDTQHGSVTTSVPEVWTTSDSGATWQKQ